jgi:hypothetical protein
VSVSPKPDKVAAAASPLLIRQPLSPITEERASQISSSTLTSIPDVGPVSAAPDSPPPSSVADIPLPKESEFEPHLDQLGQSLSPTPEEPDSPPPSPSADIPLPKDSEFEAVSDWAVDDKDLEDLKKKFPDPPPKPRAFKTSSPTYNPPEPIRRGKIPIPERTQMKRFVLLAGIEAISTSLLKEPTILPELDSFIRSGIGRNIFASSDFEAYLKENCKMEPCELVTSVFSVPRNATLRFDDDPEAHDDPKAYTTTYNTRAEQMLGALQATAINKKKLIAALLFKGESGGESPTMAIIFHQSQFYILGQIEGEESLSLYSFDGSGTARDFIVRLDPMPVLDPPNVYWLEAMVLKEC